MLVAVIFLAAYEPRGWLLLYQHGRTVIHSDKSLKPSRGTSCYSSGRGDVISQRCMGAINRSNMAYPNGVYFSFGRNEKARRQVSVNSTMNAKIQRD